MIKTIRDEAIAWFKETYKDCTWADHVLIWSTAILVGYNVEWVLNELKSELIMVLGWLQ